MSYTYGQTGVHVRITIDKIQTYADVPHQMRAVQRSSSSSKWILKVRLAIRMPEVSDGVLRYTDPDITSSYQNLELSNVAALEVSCRASHIFWDINRSAAERVNQCSHSVSEQAVSQATLTTQFPPSPASVPAHPCQQGL